MQDIKNYLLKLKKEAHKNQKEGDLVSSRIKEVIVANFENEAVLKYIRTFYIKKETLFIETTSKTMAQELYWKQEDLKEKINQEKVLIKKIVVR
ncbi:MAG: DciA family protein [bacterium]|nr:DciA family protein [bacterium]